MESLRAYNMKLVANILPVHVAEHFLKAQNKKDEVGRGFVKPETVLQYDTIFVVKTVLKPFFHRELHVQSSCGSY